MAETRGKASFLRFQMGVVAPPAILLLGAVAKEQVVLGTGEGGARLVA